MATGIGVSLAGALLGFGQAGQSLMSQVAKVTFELPNSREHETEADRMGVELAARAGYDPRAAVTLWNKMASQSAGVEPSATISTSDGPAIMSMPTVPNTRRLAAAT